MLYTQLGIIDI